MLSEQGADGARRQRLAVALCHAREVAGLSRQQLAQAAGLDRSFLSRLERGEYYHKVRRETLTRLASVLGAHEELYQAAGFLPPGVQQALSDPAHARSMADPAAAAAALRRLHVRAHAQGIDIRSLTPDGRRVDELKLWRAVSRIAGSAGPPPTTGPADPEGSAAGRRFRIAHAAAHLLLEARCQWPKLLPGEVEANYLAGLLIAPDPLVQNETSRHLTRPGSRLLWAPDAAGIVAEVADRLLVPGWVAAWRLSEAGQLDLYLTLEEEID